MSYVISFLAGLLLCNGIPHFVSGAAGKNFHRPTLGRLVPKVPTPLLNVAWGLLNFVTALLLRLTSPSLCFGANLHFASFAFGFAFAAIGLSIYFPGRDKTEAT